MARLVATANADAQGEGCTLSDKRVSTRRTKRKENKFRRTRREPEPILLRQDTKEGSDRGRVATQRRRKAGKDGKEGVKGGAKGGATEGWEGRVGRKAGRKKGRM